MKKHELLVPAGNMDCLKQAVFNGCDAVYLACKSFGARKFAANFDEEEILEAISFCHLYGVRVYVTMNTLVKDEEVENFIEQASFLHKNGVDALIVQDFGMICLLREMFPNLEIHASTQANISSKEVCRLYYDLGVKRVVFSRELSIDEIDSIDVPIEKEAFIHGALCISYSGCCLMSSMLGGRSGNRGECAGVCRMPFSLYKKDQLLVENQYLLSTKELNTSPMISRLLDSSIYSFKIEGRMKSPFYVGFITRFYRRLIDGEEFDFKQETDHLKTIFNREFTVGRMFHAEDKDFMNIKSPNHIGLEIGRVVDTTEKRIKIQLKPGYSLYQNDAIRFFNSKEGFIVNYLYDRDGKLISSSNGVCYVDNKVALKDNDIVMKTFDSQLEKEYLNVCRKKIPISYTVSLWKGKPLFISITDGNYSFSLEGSIVEKSIHAPICRNNILKQLQKLGDTPFVSNDIEIQMDEDAFVSLRELNEIRRELVSKLMEARRQSKVFYERKEVVFTKNQVPIIHPSNISCSVMKEEQLKKCLKLSVDRIYVKDVLLYSKYKNHPSVYYQIPRCTFSILDSWKDRNLVSDYANYPDESIGNYSLNVTNIYTAYYLQKIGVASICISPELTEEESLQFLDDYYSKFGYANFEALSFGKVENMIIKGNILGLDKDVYSYRLVDQKNRSFPVYYDGVCTHILNWEDCHVNYFGKFTCRLDFYQESSSEIENVIKSLQK